MGKLSTILLYSNIALIIYLLTLGLKTKNQKYFYWFIIIILTLLSGLRSSSVGMDTEGYYKIIESFGKWASIKEPGFKLSCFLLMKIFNNVHISLIVFAFFTNYLIVKLLWRFKNYCNFTVCLLYYYVFYYFTTFSGIRQWLAVAICCLGIIALFEEKNFKFFFYVIIATTFHFSAIVVISFYPILVLLSTDDTKIQIKKIIPKFIIILNLILLLYFTYKNLLLVKYSTYLNFESQRIETTFGFLQIYKLLLLFEFILFRKHNNLFSSSSFMKEKNYKFNSIPKFLLFGFLTQTLISILGYSFKNITRIAWYLVPLEILFIGLIFNLDNKKNSLSRVLIVLLIILVFIRFLSGDGNKVIPYSFFWN